jgi:ribosome maturation factor RimP
MDVLDKITGLARGVAESHGLELVDAELFRAGRRRMLRVYVGKASGVSVEDCARISREVSAVLDAENWLGTDPYTLEVSSPGLDRPFKTLPDWRRNIGREIQVTCREPVEGKIQHQGLLSAVDEEAATLTVDSGALRIPLRLVAVAKIEIKIS